MPEGNGLFGVLLRRALNYRPNKRVRIQEDWRNEF